MSDQQPEQLAEHPDARLEKFAAALEAAEQEDLESFRAAMSTVRPRSASARLRKHHHLIDRWAERGYSLTTICGFLRENYDVDIDAAYLATIRHRERRRKAKLEAQGTAKKF